MMAFNMVDEIFSFNGYKSDDTLEYRPPIQDSGSDQQQKLLQQGRIIHSVVEATQERCELYKRV